MKNFYFAFVAMLLLSVWPAGAQIVTTTPSPLQESSRNVVLTYDAASPLGNQGLLNLATGFDVYAHIGVITSESTGPGDWRHVVTPWPEAGNSQVKLPMARISVCLWWLRASRSNSAAMPKVIFSLRPLL